MGAFPPIFLLRKFGRKTDLLRPLVKRNSVYLLKDGSYRLLGRIKMSYKSTENPTKIFDTRFELLDSFLDVTGMSKEALLDEIVQGLSSDEFVECIKFVARMYGVTGFDSVRIV